MKKEQNKKKNKKEIFQPIYIFYFVKIFFLQNSFVPRISNPCLISISLTNQTILIM
jgi:uncharacterized membrane protein YadS